MNVVGLRRWRGVGLAETGWRGEGGCGEYRSAITVSLSSPLQVESSARGESRCSVAVVFFEFRMQRAGTRL